MITTDKTGVQLFVQCCVNNGMRIVVCSPGSRNAPLVIAFDEHPDIETCVIHDERSAAFYGLGMAIEEDAPVGLVCTSGSAMLNYYPAVAEAYYQCVPLVVMSADRPAEWINHGDGQTIVQEGVYANHIKAEMTIPEFISENETADLIQKINNAFDQACTDWIGPVHFNFPLSEPLYKTVDIEYQQPLLRERILLSEMPDVHAISKMWNSSQRKMILCGQLRFGTATEKLLNALSEDSSLIVLVENTSNLTGQRFVQCIDRTLNLISEEELHLFQPELLITLGGAIVSKRIKTFLRNADIREHWKIGFDFPEMDTFRALTKSIAVKPEDFIQMLLQDEFAKNTSNYGSKWKQLDYIVKDKLPHYLDQVPFSDLSVFHSILDYLPEDVNLHMANSSVVRYCQLFDPLATVRYYCNRGTSGIDGSVSTACGVALSTPQRKNILITGDVSFFYDSNALWNRYIGANLRIILVNNSGGGIFRFIDGPSQSSKLEEYFEARHNTSAEHICRAFGVRYASVKDQKALESELPDLYSDNNEEKPALLEIFTPPELNDVVLREFFKASKNWKLELI